MLQKNELLSPPATARTDPPTTEAVPDSTQRPTRWPWVVGAALVAVLAAAAVYWWLLDSTVSQDLYDETVAELTVAEESLAAAHDDAAELQSELDALSREIEELTTAVAAGADQVAELRGRLDAAETATRFLAYRYVTGTPEDLAALLDGGFDTTSADAILQHLGETETLTEWVEGTPWVMIDHAVSDIDDEMLTTAWSRYLEADVGSMEETVAVVEFEGRLLSLILDALND